MPKRPLSPQPEADSLPRATRARKSRIDTSIHRSVNGPEEQARTWVQEKLDLPGAEVFYIPEFVDFSASKDWYRQLDELETWYHPKLKVYGKEVSQSRSIAAYATDKALTVRYSGHQVVLHYIYPDVLTAIQNMVEEKLGVNFNHVMLNRYADGTEYIGKHRDTKENKVIASLSFGAERTFILTPNNNCPGNPKRHSLVLGNGSLLIMQGHTQKNWKHEIPKESGVKDGRISLTFRQLVKG